MMFSKEWWYHFGTMCPYDDDYEWKGLIAHDGKNCGTLCPDGIELLFLNGTICPWYDLKECVMIVINALWLEMW